MYRRSSSEVWGYQAQAHQQDDFFVFSGLQHIVFIGFFSPNFVQDVSLCSAAYSPIKYVLGDQKKGNNRNESYGEKRENVNMLLRLHTRARVHVLPSVPIVLNFSFHSLPSLTFHFNKPKYRQYHLCLDDVFDKPGDQQICLGASLIPTANCWATPPRVEV